MWRDTHALYPFQQTAAERMRECNVLLAFEMGTGKTPTTLWALEQLRDSGEIKGAGIILAPASLMYQWGREIEKFTTSSYVVITGPPKTRDVLYLTAGRFDYVIMTYDTFVRDQLQISILKGLDAFIVLDEATAIKTFKAKRTKELKRVRDRYEVRYALSGTPIENGKPEELFSILEWVDPRIPGSWWKFEKDHLIRNDFGWITGYRNILKFHQKVKPNLLRKRINEPDVGKYLPAVITPEPYEIFLDSKTERLYRQIVDDILVDLSLLAEKLSESAPHWDSEDPDHPDGKMMAKIQTARMLLDHPVAVYASAARFADPDDDRGSSYADELVNAGMIDGLKPVKFDAFLNYMGEFLERDEENKAVVFCSFVDVAHALHDALPGSVVFTGSMSPKERDVAVVRFQTDPGCRVFVSTDAGGYGLDLPQANLLVNYDMPWQAGLLKQRNARIRRASSEWKHVVVQDFIVMETIEERLLHMLNHKIAVSEAFVDGEGVLEDGSLGSNLDTLRSFLTPT